MANGNGYDPPQGWGLAPWGDNWGDAYVYTPTQPVPPPLESTALTIKDISVFLQVVTSWMLGINPADPSLVRIDWPEEGQPFEDRTTDICYLKCIPQDVDYNRVRDRELVLTPAGWSEHWYYTKAWEVSWTLYGPSSEDRARMVRSALYLDYYADQLAQAGLFPVPDAPEITRMPEQFNAQWWERADYHITMYEQVTESALLTGGIATSVEVKVYDTSGQVADVNIAAS